jgi:hemerythrin superfamily protein
MDVIQLLKKDHKAVKKMFEEFEGLSGRAAQKKLDLVGQILQALTVHARVEEELVYPVFKEIRAMKNLVCEAAEEHHVAKMLSAELEELRPDDERYEAKVKVLGEYVLHHVKEEEQELFPQAGKRLSPKRLEALGKQVETRRSELMGEGKDGEAEDTEGLDETAEVEDVKGKDMRIQRGGRRAA